MALEIEFASNWARATRNVGEATKGNVEDVILGARLLPNAGPLRIARHVLVEAGVHKSPGPVRDAGRRPGGGVERGGVGDWHWHVTVRIDSRRSSWHINVYQGKGGLWEPISLYKRPGERHFEQESPGSAAT